MFFWSWILKSGNMLHGHANHHFEKYVLAIPPYLYHTSFAFLSTREMTTNRSPALNNLETTFKVDLIGIHVVRGCRLAHGTWCSWESQRSKFSPSIMGSRYHSRQAFRASPFTSWPFCSLEPKFNVIWKVSSSFLRSIYIRMISGYAWIDFEGISKHFLFRKRNTILKLQTTMSNI